MLGAGFSAIPGDAIAVWAISNDAPLAYRDTQETAQTFDVVVNSDNELTCIPRAVYVHTVPVYVGAILSADRSEVLWVNETRPLP